MAVTLNITGTLSLNINDTTNYLFDWNADGTALFDPGAVTWVRELVGSPYVHGEYEAGARKGLVQATCPLNIFGTTAANLKTAITNAINAFSQSTYTLTLVVDGQSYAWTCMRADYAPAWSGLRTFDSSGKFHSRMVFSFPRQPVATVGPF